MVYILNLQENQVTSLKSKGVPAEFLSSTQTAKNKNEVGIYALSKTKRKGPFVPSILESHSN